MKKKVFLIQNTIAPYRVPLFHEISKSDQIDFTLLLMAKEKPDYLQWGKIVENLPFKSKQIAGFRIRLKLGAQICFNPSLLIYLFKKKPDVVFCCGFNLSTLLIFIYRYFSKSKMLIWMEGNKITENVRNLNFIRKTIRSILARRADGFIDAGKLSNEYIKSLLSKTKNVNIYRSYNCIDSCKFKAACNDFKSNKKVFLEKIKQYPKKNILFAGRLNSIKNIKFMIETYKKLIDIMEEDVGLIILGQGELKSYLLEEKKRLPYLYIEGFKEGDEYPKYFAFANLFLLLSKYDCSPLVIIEALSAGVPIIASNKVGNAIDFIENKKNGFIVSLSNQGMIVNKIYTILNDPDCDQYKKNSLEKIKSVNYQNSAQAFINAALNQPKL